MKNYDFLEPAQIELEKEVKYYNEQQLGLGYEFASGSRRYDQSDIEASSSLDPAFQTNSPMQNKKISIRGHLPNQRRQNPDYRRCSS